MTVWAKLSKFPPVLVRLLARENGEAMSDTRIAEASGGAVSVADVKRLSYLKSWDDVSVRHMRWFCIACGADFEDRNTLRNLNRYMKNPRFEHLRRHKNWPHFKELLALYAETLR